jgi:hypothetical protein
MIGFDLCQILGNAIIWCVSNPKVVGGVLQSFPHTSAVLNFLEIESWDGTPIPPPKENM